MQMEYVKITPQEMMVRVCVRDQHHVEANLWVFHERFHRRATRATQ